MKKPTVVERASRKILAWDRLLLFCLRIDRHQKMEKAQIDVRFEPGDRNRLEKLAGIRPDHLCELQRGCLAVIGSVDDKPVYYAFVNLQAVHDPALLHVPLRPHQAYVYRVYTDPHYRGLNIAPAGYGYLATRFAVEGKTELWVAVSSQNSASIRSIVKSGFRRAGQVLFVQRRKSPWILYRDLDALTRVPIGTQTPSFIRDSEHE